MSIDLSALYPVVFNTLDIGGVFVAAVLGGMVAREKHFDAVGFVVVAIMSALGGGMIRDVLIANGPNLHQPPVALTNPLYLPMALLGAAVAYLIRVHGKWIMRSMTVMDAFVIGAWTATGVTKTLDAGFSYVPAAMMGVITAVGGGMVRDIMVGRTPVIFGGNTLYATASVIGTIPASIFWYVHMPSVGMVVTTCITAGVAILARYRGWKLPQNRDYSVNDTLAKVSSSLSARLAVLRSEERRAQVRAERQARATRRRNQSKRSLRQMAQHRKTQQNNKSTQNNSGENSRKNRNAENRNAESS
ncbi:Uncharacterized membrane protein YeiH [Actinobaculum suis]|uniref:TRIC cation channel family protein n=1 Tax=Actinobaculum suis TaxID=1657 RepID=A0A1G7CZJ1_9ACTO|nr:trimeric intracellular cation channel family protein [Actinobaculum suis]MDY5152796.1 TRIC cation channel family protein [Actinobaculum suis]SDE44707.1 Uncharacterized membrane protein YeiH [Actinobaculum suis]